MSAEPLAAGERTEVRSAAKSPCVACPWRTANHGRRTPDGWYAKANLHRLWSGLRTGDAPGMTCHPTDPSNPVSEEGRAAGLKVAPDGAATLECAGSVILLQREWMKFEAAGRESDRTGEDAYRIYRRDNPGALTREQLLNVAFRAQGAPSFFTGSPVEMRTDHDLDEPVGVPGRVPWTPGVSGLRDQ